MSATHMQRRRMTIRRRGRHATLSQVERVAEKAGRAAPAVAIAGVLVAVPHGDHGAGARAGEPATVTAALVQQATNTRQAAERRHTATGREAAMAAARAASRDYDVRSGDTLSGIAKRYYHDAREWRWLYHVNGRRVSDPDLIFPGERLSVPDDPPPNYSLPGYQPRHARRAVTGGANARNDRSAVTRSESRSSSARDMARTRTIRRTSLSGTLSCTGLENLWQTAGGSSGQASTAASIAMAESGGSQYATNGSSGTRGYWQISPSWGTMSTYNALGNAEAAVRISGNGADWSPWTTYTSGAYAGRC